MAAARRLVVMCIYLLNGNVLFVLCNFYTPEVKLAQGPLRGLNYGSYNAYFGIPYASVPMRFREAGPPPSWSGTFRATNGSIKCSQMLPMLNIPVGREDCLVANIYTPSKRNSNLLPVMVFIHGGGFYFGSNTNLLYDAKYLVQKDVVVVAINYRLGAFGFLCLTDTEVSGNMGLKDQIAALRWIKQNIQVFGGDPDSVTLVGESAGATAAHYIAFSKLGKGLFNRIILESGSILIPISFEDKPLSKAQILVSRLGYNVTSPKEILRILEETDAIDIIKASSKNRVNSNRGLFLFEPCAENPKTSKNPIITTNPRTMLKYSRLDPNISVITGFNDKEGIMFAGTYTADDIKKIDKDFSQILPRNLRFPNKEEQYNVIQDIRKLYFGDKPIKTSSDLIDFFSDTIIIYPSVETTNNFLSRNATVFSYIFKYGSLRNLNKFVSGIPLTPGANHADELFYLFDPIMFKLLPNLPMDKMIIDVMTTSWTNFAKTGNPSSGNINWIRNEENNLNFLSFGNEILTTSLPFSERMRFWKKVYEKYAAF